MESGSHYAEIPGVDPWPESRDARGYAGPYPVVAHPPCERWGRYWSGGPSARKRRRLGDDGGCFESALAAVRAFGGVLEHPEASHAWRRFGIARPLRFGGWTRTLCGGWTCCVEQGNYGHSARKATWLYVFGVENPPSLKWGPSPPGLRIDPGFHSAEERRAASSARRLGKRLSKLELLRTPPQFAALLLRGRLSGLARRVDWKPLDDLLQLVAELEAEASRKLDAARRARSDRAEREASARRALRESAEARRIAEIARLVDEDDADEECPDGWERVPLDLVAEELYA
jgi:hypothetical protein